MRLLSATFVLFFLMSFISDIAGAFDPGSHQQSLDMLKQSLQQTPSSKENKLKLINYYLVMGREKIKRGKYEEALSVLEEGHSYDPDGGEFYFLKGLSYYLMKRLYEAESELMNIVYDDDATVDSLKLLGRVYYDRADLEAALGVWNRAIAIAPDDEELQAIIAKATKETAVESSMSESYTGRFLLQYDGERDEAMGQKVSAILESAYEDVGIDLGHYPERDILVILYTGKQFKSLTDAPDWVGGIYDGKLRIPAGGGIVSDEALEALLYHEYTHAAVHSLAGGRVPAWLNEGLATYEQSRFHKYHQGFLEKAAENNNLMELTDIDEAFSSNDTERVRLAYEQSYSFVNYLIVNYGMFRIKQVFGGLQSTGSVNASFRKVYGDHGKTLDTLFRDWQKTLQPEN